MVETAINTSRWRERTWINLLRGLAVAGVLCWLGAFALSADKIGRPFPGFLVEPPLNFAVHNDSRWPGYQSGMRRADFLLEANGTALKTHDDLDRLVRSVPVGTAIQYRYLRRAESRMVVIPTQRFSIGDFLVNFLPHLILGGIYLAIGIFSFAMATSNPAAQAFLLMTLFAGVSQVAFNDWHWNPRVFGFDFRYVVTMLLNANLVHFGLVFPEPRGFLKKRLGWVYLVYLPTLAIAALGIGTYHGFGAPIAGPHWQDYLGLWQRNSWTMLICFTLHTTLLLNASARARSIGERNQAKLIATGGAVAMSAQFMVIVVPQLLGISAKVPPLTNLLASVLFLAFPLTIAFAILRHRLFNIELIIKQTIAYTVVVGVLTGVYFVLITLLRGLLDQVLGLDNSAAYNLPATAAVAVLFGPVRDKTKDMVERMFFRGSYDFQQVVARFAETTRDLPLASQVTEALLTEVEAAMHPTYLAILLRSDQQPHLEMARALGERSLSSSRLPSDHPLLSEMQARGMSVTPTPQDIGEFKAAHILPLQVQDTLIGCVIVGPRKSDLPYAEQDRLLLMSLVQQLEKKFQEEELERKVAEALRVRGMLSRYVSPQVAETLLQQDFDPSQGHRQRVTLLFSDIRGFTQMSETMDPEEVVSILNAYFSRMVRAVFAFDGMLDKYIGDGMMVVFGAPVPRRDHAWRAVQAALRMRHELELFNLDRADAGLFPLRIGIGLNTGDVVIGNIGTEQRLDYTAIGDAVNTASRIESLTKEYSVDILMSASTYEEVEAFVVARKVNEVEIRGKVERLDLYVLEGLKPGIPRDYLTKRQTGSLSDSGDQATFASDPTV